MLGGVIRSLSNVWPLIGFETLPDLGEIGLWTEIDRAKSRAKDPTNLNSHPEHDCVKLCFPLGNQAKNTDQNEDEFVIVLHFHI